MKKGIKITTTNNAFVLGFAWNGQGAIGNDFSIVLGCIIIRIYWNV